jgi:hypothetical protein
MFVAAGFVLAAVALAAGCGGGESGPVGTADIEDGAVVTAKIADGAVTPEKVSDEILTASDLEGAKVTTAALADDAVTGDKVADDSLSGADIDESALEGVDAATLNGQSDYLRGISGVTKTSSLNNVDRKGPVTATCESGTKVVGGGASIVTEDNKKVPVALTATTSNTGNGWYAEAIEVQPVDSSWGLRVIAVCAVLG